MVAVIYTGFTATLLESSSTDQRHGALFAWNVPFVISLAIAAFWSQRAAALLALIAAGLQLVIVGMWYFLSIGGASRAVLTINIPLILVFYCLAIWAGRSRPQHAEEVPVATES